jgi:uncharacterized protein (DUF2147 family)
MRVSAILAGMTALALAGTTPAGPALASPAEGVWRTPTEHADIQLYDCGAFLCGRVIASDGLKLHPEVRNYRDPDPAKRNILILGMTFLTGFSGGPPKWRHGAVYNPQDGHTYHGTITMLDHDTLHLQGCIIFPLCATQTWKREH